MELPGIHADLVRLPGALPIWRGAVDAPGWQVAASTMAKAGGRLVALWASDRGQSSGPAVCAATRSVTGAFLDVHLMISPVDPFVEAFAEAGADIITVHPEAGPHVHRTVQAIKALIATVGLSAGAKPTNQV